MENPVLGHSWQEHWCSCMYEKDHLNLVIWFFVR